MDSFGQHSVEFEGALVYLGHFVRAVHGHNTSGSLLFPQIKARLTLADHAYPFYILLIVAVNGAVFDRAESWLILIRSNLCSEV